MARDTVETPAREALKTWVEARPRGARKGLAERLGVSEQLVSQWIAGSCRPGPIYRDALEPVTGIDPGEWETAEERAKRKRAMVGPETSLPEPSVTGSDGRH